MDELLQSLESFPRFLTEALDRIGDPGARARPAPDSWSLDEQLWHLADLEREGWLARIERLLEENSPELADFDGDTLAEQRDYRSKDPYLGLSRFRAARTASLARLCALEGPQWQRTGKLEGRGTVALSDLPRLMHEHDAGHRREIEALLAARPAR